MQTDGKWTPHHTRRVRARLVKALRCVVESLADTLRPPTNRPNPPPGRRRVRTSFRCPSRGGLQCGTLLSSTVLPPCPPGSSGEPLSVTACLPLRLQCRPHSTEYLLPRGGHPHEGSHRPLIARLADEVAQHLRSVSRAHLQRIAGFLDTLIHGQPPVPPVWHGTTPACDTQGRWEWIRDAMTAQKWLVQYGVEDPNCQRVRFGPSRCETIHTGTAPLSFEVFRRHMRYISLLCGPVLQGRRNVDFPLPTAGSRVQCSEVLTELSSTQSSDHTVLGPRESLIGYHHPIGVDPLDPLWVGGTIARGEGEHERRAMDEHLTESLPGVRPHAT